MLRKSMRVLSSVVGFAALLYGASPAWAQATAPNLGSESTYGIVSSTLTNTVAGSTINGDVCYTTGPATAPTISGATVVPCPPATGTDQGSALSNLNGQACTSIGAAVALNSVSIGGGAPGTFPPGCYSSTGAMSIATGTTVNLNGAGVYIFRPGGALNPAANSRVVGASVCANDVFWAPNGATTIGANATFVGNILEPQSAGAFDITIGSTVTFQGRALAFGKTVTIDTDTITVPTCTPYVAPGAAVPPTLGKGFSPVSISAGGISLLTITLSNSHTTVATLTSLFTDTLPTGVVIAPTPNVSTTCGGAGAVSATAGGSTVTLAAGRTIPVAGTCTVTVNVTAPAAGSYINTLAAGALQTSNGSNALAARATLTVVAVPVPGPPVPPTLAKAFSPFTVAAGGAVSTLTITLSNPDSETIITDSLIDTLPAGVVIAATPDASTTCPGSPAVVATPGGNTVTLPANGRIPGATGSTPGTCTVTVSVTAAAAGNYVNTLPINALKTNNGNNAAPAIATLTVVPAVPTLSEWAMIMLAGLLSLAGFAAIRRRRAL